MRNFNGPFYSEFLIKMGEEEAMIVLLFLIAPYLDLKPELQKMLFRK